MAEERSLIAVERAHQGSQRFDYFVLGVSIALCAYIGQTISPQKLGWSPNSLEVASVIFLIISAFCGFKRIEARIRMDELNHEILDAYEKRGRLVSHGVTGRPFINQSTGDVLGPSELQEKKADIEKALPRFHADLAKVHERSENLYRWRNRLLAVGFIGLFLAKVLLPYFAQCSTRSLL